MPNLNLFFLCTSLTSYLIGTIIYLVALKTNEKKWEKKATYITCLGLGIHTLALAIRWYEAGYPPLTSFHESMSGFAWAIVILYLILEFHYDIRSLGAFVVPIAFCSLLFAMFLPNEIRPLAPILKSKWLKIHVTVGFFAYASFAMAAALGAMYLILEKQIKSKRPHAFYYRLPSLDILDALSYRLISAGFPLLTISIIIGAFWAQDVWGSYWRWEPKETWSLVSWILYATLLHGRQAIGWRGKKSAYWSFIGFAAIVFTFLGVNILGRGLHIFPGETP